MKAYTERVFGNVEGEDVLAYRFETDGGYQLEVMTYGATILRYVAPDKAGNFANVILGFDDFDSYVGNSPKHGASVGPVAGRIAGATLSSMVRPMTLRLIMLATVITVVQLVGIPACLKLKK